MAAIAYRPEIDGLRAIAVLSVFIFHLQPEWLPGGFVGVDVFFVISGYLITSIIAADCRNNSFSIAKFYQRRVARIFPAFFVVAFATVIAAYFIQSPQDFSSCGANLTAATLSLANIKYMLQGNYFQISPDAQPFLHYWSLSVEEQFYMLFPLMFAWLYRKRQNWLVPLIVISLFLSLIACILVTRTNPTWAFYLLPTRGWELLAGCWLAVITFGNDGRHNFRWQTLLSTLGLLAVLTSIVVLDESPAFPGYQALLPVLGTVAIIGFAGPRDWVGKLLSTAPMVFVGKISYSLYLWHWPVFSFVDYTMYLSSNSTRTAIKVLLSVVATLICYLVIEKPTRSFLNDPAKRRFTFASVGIVVMIAATVGVVIRNVFYLNASPGVVSEGGLQFGDSSSDTSVVLMGDSHASTYGWLCREIAQDLNYKLNIISVAAGDPLPACKPTQEVPKLWRDSLDAVESIRPTFLVLAIRWDLRIASCPDRLTRAIEQLKKHTQRIILITQPPVLPEQATRSAVRAGSRPPFIEPAEYRASRLKMNSFVKSFASDRVTVIDIEPTFGTNSGEVHYWDDNGQLLYQDDDHLSVHGTQYVKKMLINALDRSTLRAAR